MINVEHSLCMYIGLCAKSFINIISTSHTLKDSYYYSHFIVKKVGMLRDVKNLHKVTQLTSGRSKCRTGCLSLGHPESRASTGTHVRPCFGRCRPRAGRVREKESEAKKGTQGCHEMPRCLTSCHGTQQARGQVCLLSM